MEIVGSSHGANIEKCTIVNMRRFKSTIIQAWIEALDPCPTKYSSISNNFHPPILPIFPERNDSDEFYPLLTNIPYKELSKEEWKRRQRHFFMDAIIDKPLTINNSYKDDEEIGNDLRNLFQYYSQLWHVPQDLLVINFNRLLTILPQLTLHDFIEKQQDHVYELSLEEWFLLLEIYLQMDVQCFFMKTCTFRTAQPRSPSEGLFCMLLPEAEYGMKQCRDKSCRFCYERLKITKRSQPTMNFSDHQLHQCINQYQVYLNCHVTCTTSNLIYALTCPCHHYDYIGRCRVPFRDRMWIHRMDGCRLMNNFFLGPTVADRLQHAREQNPMITDTHVKLYQHSMECPMALEIFLTSHPDYWCFIPMTMEQATMDNTTMTATDTDILTQYHRQGVTKNSEEPSPSLRHTKLVYWCMDHVPQPPPSMNYQFSLRQKVEQFHFFRNRLDLSPSRFLDLYNATILMALPEKASDELRHSVQALFVAYTEPKLNIMADEQTHFTPSKQHCCEYLIHPRFR